MNGEEKQEALLADLTGDNEDRAEEAARQLAEIGAPILPALGRLLESNVGDRRWWGVRTLGQMAAPPRDWLIRSLADPSGEVRAAAALGLAAHPAEEAAPALAGALQDEDSIVAILAVNALLAIGAPAVQALLDLFPKSNQRGQIQIMRTLADLRDHRTIPLMMKSVEADSAMIRYWAEQGLERLGLDMVYLKPE